MSASDDDPDDSTSSTTPATITLAGDAARMRRTLETLTSSVEDLRSQMEPPAARLGESRRRVAEAVRPLVESSRRIQTVVEQDTADLATIVRDARRVVKAATAGSDRLEEVRLAIDGSAVEAARAVARQRRELRAALDAVLRANPSATGIGEPEAAADRILDEIARPPDEASADDVLDHLLARVAGVGKTLGLTRGHLVAIVAAIVATLVGSWCDRQGRARLEEGQDRLRDDVGNLRRTTAERLDRIEERIDDLDDDSDGDPETEQTDRGGS